MTIIGNIKKCLWILAIGTALCFPSFSYSQNSEPANIEGLNISSAYVDNLRTVWFPVDEILQAEVISRYDVTRLLNAVECLDCLNPAQPMINEYIRPFWSNFVATPWEDFRDILFREAFYREWSYYYCVAYAADNEYMNGFPVATSPICWWLFCGANNTTKAEFLQIIVNVVEKFTFEKYSINRQEVRNRRDWLDEWTYTHRYMNSLDDQRINAGIARCWSTTCPLADRWEFKTYRKYCTFELEKCWNRTFWFLQAWRWPVAELNVLEKENILTDQNVQNTIHDPVDWKVVLETFWKLFPIISCEFDNDYDCDNINNNFDTCPNAYNPRQRDLDQDWVWNVCDPDIDWDLITNPIWIVDDNDSIIISKYDSDMDNCLFTINTDQADANDNRKGDACDGLQEYVSLWIEPIIDQQDGPLSLWLQARAIGAFDSIIWDMWDGNTKQWETIIHTYSQPGSYTVIAKANWLRNDAIAKTTVIVWESLSEPFGMQNTSETLQGSAPFAAQLTHEILSDRSLNTEILINDEVDRNLWSATSFNKSFPKAGNYKVTAVTKEWDEILAVTQYNIGVGDNALGSRLTTESIIAETEENITFNTIIEGNLDLNPVSYILREFWDGEQIRTNSINYEKKFNEWWKKVVIQHIILENNDILTNFLTMYIEQENTDSSNNNISLKVEPWFIQEGESTFYETLLFNLSENQILQKVINFDDWTTEIFDWEEVEKTYPLAWIYFPSSTYYLESCRVLHSSATLVVTSNNTCLDALLNDTLDQFKCDLDTDGIPDVCDEDIDGDWNPNEIWLVLFEQDDCSIDAQNINPGKTQEHLEWVCSIDNCPFVANSDQLDLNNDWLWDWCPELAPYAEELLDPSERDTDWDWYTDDRDACATLAENFNNVEDADWCPEIWEDDPCTDIAENPFVNALNCNSCPCHFADFGWTLQQWDKVRAILTDQPWDVDYTRSFPKVVN